MNFVNFEGLKGHVEFGKIRITERFHTVTIARDDMITSFLKRIVSRFLRERADRKRKSLKEINFLMPKLDYQDDRKNLST